MKKRILQFVSISFISLSVFSCGKDDGTGGNNGGGNTNEPITLECRYTTDITLTNQNPDGVDYIIDCELEIRDGSFIIDPGTTIQFAEGASLTVEAEGIFKAQGISGSQVIMTGTDPGRASWRGIYINSNKGANKLEHVIIEDAGDGEGFGLFNDNNAAVTFQGRLNMSNCTIKNSGDNGIFSLEELNLSQVDLFANNTISGCKQYPVLVKQDHITNMDLNSCTFIENGINMIGLHQEDSDRLNSESTFEALDIPYFIEDGFELYASLTLEAGVEIVMGSGSFINSIRNKNQYLLIQGSQSNHVTIRGKEAISGYWEGIYLTEVNSLNIWEYLDLSDGGSIAQGHGDLSGNVTLEQGASLTINNCTSSRSGGNCDIVLNDFGGVPTLTNNSPQITSVCEE